MMRFLLLLVLAFSTTILPSCKVEGDEEVTLKADGSSQIRLDYLMPDFVVTAQEGKSLVDYVYSLDDKYSGIKVSEASYRKSDGIVGDQGGGQARRLVIDLECSSLDTLKNVAAKEAKNLTNGGSEGALDPKMALILQRVLGEVSADLRGTRVFYSREIKTAGLPAGLTPDRDKLKDVKIRYTLTTPTVATDHNALSSSNNGKTLYWEMTPDHYMGEPFVMKATLPIPLSVIPWWVWVVGGLVILFVLWVLWKIVRWFLG